MYLEYDAIAPGIGSVSGAISLFAARLDFLTLLVRCFASQLDLPVTLDVRLDHANPLLCDAARPVDFGCGAEGINCSLVLPLVVQAHAERDLRIVDTLQAAFAKTLAHRCNALVVLAEVQVGVAQPDVEFTVVGNSVAASWMRGPYGFLDLPGRAICQACDSSR